MIVFCLPNLCTARFILWFNDLETVEQYCMLLIAGLTSRLATAVAIFTVVMLAKVVGMFRWLLLLVEEPVCLEVSWGFVAASVVVLPPVFGLYASRDGSVFGGTVLWRYIWCGICIVPSSAKMWSWICTGAVGRS